VGDPILAFSRGVFGRVQLRGCLPNLLRGDLRCPSSSSSGTLPLTASLPHLMSFAPWRTDRKEMKASDSIWVTLNNFGKSQFYYEDHLLLAPWYLFRELCSIFLWPRTHLFLGLRSNKTPNTILRHAHIELTKLRRLPYKLRTIIQRHIYTYEAQVLSSPPSFTMYVMPTQCKLS